ncbi:C2H2-type zinc finger protein [Halosimplex marinum]|uniref:C2H2-type zinc finger protein n=1 Tax=Halosimplex marinum TaxID=3396620 RepID=UPI003F5656A5
MTEQPATDAGRTDDRDDPGASGDSGDPGADDIAYDVPPGASPVECAYCGRPFESEGLLALHRERAHSSVITDDERTAYEEAHDAESGQLQRFRLKALAVLVLLYFGLLMVYAVV